jgi:uncharacterized protein YwgA
LVHAAGGTLEHRIRLQKSAYLLQRLGTVDFRSASFKYHHYGPYSRSLSDAIQTAVASGLLREDGSGRADGELFSYTYVLTDSGRAWVLENATEPDPLVTRHAPRLRDEPWRVLELASTTLFLERDERLSGRDEAMRRAIQLKPACEPFRAQAERLLADLSLA